MNQDIRAGSQTGAVGKLTDAAGDGKRYYMVEVNWQVASVDFRLRNGELWALADLKHLRT